MGWLDEAKDQLQRALGTKKVIRKRQDGEEANLLLKDPTIYLDKLNNIISKIYKGQEPYDYFLKFQSARISQLSRASQLENDDTSYFDLEQFQKKSRILEDDYVNLIKKIYSGKNIHSTFPIQFYKILVRGDSIDNDVFIYTGAYSLSEDGYDIYIPVIFLLDGTLFSFVYQFYDKPSEILYGSNYIGNSLDLYTVQKSEMDVKSSNKIQKEIVLIHTEINPVKLKKSIRRMEVLNSGKSKTSIVPEEESKNYFIKAYRILRMASFLDYTRQEHLYSLLDLVEQTILPGHKKSLLDKIPLLDEI
ncbi:MAG: hypothetical protein JXA60_07440 [Candidatus Coatesbacteria bacterium]|nr:hypothetical protein [Candidatus Coatesbacteria bacterium]